MSGPKTEAPAASTAGAPVPLSIGIALNIVNAPFFVGVDKGIYLKHGLDAKLVTAPAGNDAMKALVAGQYQVMSSAWSVVAPAVVQGTPLKVISLISGGPQANYDDQLEIVVRPGLSVKSITDLKGKKIASVFGTTPEIWIRTRLKDSGLDPSKDVKLINVAFANMLSVLQTGAADAAVPVEPYGTLITRTLAGSTGLLRGGGIVDGHQILIATPSWIAKNPDLVDRVIAANYEADQYAREHPEETAAAASHYLSGLDQETLVASLKTLRYDPRWADSVEEGFTKTSQQLVDAGLMKSVPDTVSILELDKLRGAVTKEAQYTTDLK
ncbi:MAG: ABC transporter substrate-binding protein [Chloroflexota bacterium]|nr:ABC transporter substrate-binding protein [Chloroflexota bacterium]